MGNTFASTKQRDRLLELIQNDRFDEASDMLVRGGGWWTTRGRRDRDEVVFVTAIQRTAPISLLKLLHAKGWARTFKFSLQHKCALTAAVQSSADHMTAYRLELVSWMLNTGSGPQSDINYANHEACIAPSSGCCFCNTLWCALYAQRKEETELLLRLGADPNIMCRNYCGNGQTVFVAAMLSPYCTRNGGVESVLLHSRVPVSFELRWPIFGRTLVHNMVAKCTNAGSGAGDALSPQRIKIMLDKLDALAAFLNKHKFGILNELHDDVGSTPFEEAAAKSSALAVPVLDILARYGSNVFQYNRFGQRPFAVASHEAVRAKLANLELAQLLLGMLHQQHQHQRPQGTKQSAIGRLPTELFRLVGGMLAQDPTVAG